MIIQNKNILLYSVILQQDTSVSLNS